MENMMMQTYMIEDQIDSIKNKIVAVEDELNQIMPSMDSWPDSMREELVRIICDLQQKREDLIAKLDALEESRIQSMTF